MFECMKFQFIKFQFKKKVKHIHTGFPNFFTTKPCVNILQPSSFTNIPSGTFGLGPGNSGPRVPLCTLYYWCMEVVANDGFNHSMYTYIIILIVKVNVIALCLCCIWRKTITWLYLRVSCDNLLEQTPRNLSWVTPRFQEINYYMYVTALVLLFVWDEGNVLYMYISLNGSSGL